MISADTFTAEAVKERYDYYKALAESTGEDPSQYILTDEEIETLVKEKPEYQETCVQPFIEKLGNVTFVNIVGHHYIYAHRPDDVAKAVDDFLKAL